jgi:hypothetical protein
MLLLTEDAILMCAHPPGHASVEATQNLVTINGRRVLIEPNPVGRRIVTCPNISITIKPCNNTLEVQSGYSDLLRINGKRVCLDSVEGLTDGTPPRFVKYKVRTAGQSFVFQNQ